MSGEIEVNKCDFCGEVKQVGRVYIHAKNTSHIDTNEKAPFVLVSYCYDCGCEQVEQLAALNWRTMTRKLPQEEGFYWYVPDVGSHAYRAILCHIKKDEGEWKAMAVPPGPDDYYGPLKEVYPGYWSTAPVTPDPAPKEKV